MKKLKNLPFDISKEDILKQFSYLDDYPQCKIQEYFELIGTKSLYKYYEPIFDLDLTNATRYQFREAFKSFGTKEGVLVKCEAFFIQASKYSNIVLSTHILARRHNVNFSNSNDKNKQKLGKLNFSESVNSKISIDKNINVVKIILDKYPDFDPNWLPDVQKAWIDSLTKLYESLNKS